MFLLHRIRFFYFIASFAIGLFVVYVFQPPPEIVYKFPNPFNVGKIIYKHDDVCYKYSATSHDCPLNKSAIKAQPF